MWELSMQALFTSLMLGDASGVSGVDWKEDEGASLSSPYENQALYKYLIAHTNFLKRMINGHIFMNILTLDKNNSALSNLEIWQYSACFRN